jgi:hypothetical protein
MTWKKSLRFMNRDIEVIYSVKWGEGAGGDWEPTTIFYGSIPYIERYDKHYDLFKQSQEKWIILVVDILHENIVKYLKEAFDAHQEKMDDLESISIEICEWDDFRCSKGSPKTLKIGIGGDSLAVEYIQKMYGVSASINKDKSTNRWHSTSLRIKLLHEFEHHISQLNGNPHLQIQQEAVAIIREYQNNSFVMLNRAKTLLSKNSSFNEEYKKYKKKYGGRFDWLSHRKDMDRVMKGCYHLYGHLTGFFIGLYHIKRFHPSAFRKLRVFDKKKNPRFLTENWKEYLLDANRPIFFDNIPKRYTNEVIALINGLGPRQYVRAYLSAISNLGVPRKFALVTPNMSFYINPKDRNLSFHSR